MKQSPVIIIQWWLPQKHRPHPTPPLPNSPARGECIFCLAQEMMSSPSFLDSHGGLFNNNLGNILHLEENDYDDDMENQVTFKLSQYFDPDNINIYTSRNQNSINIMSFNALLIWQRIDSLKIQLELLARLNHTVHIISAQEAWIKRGQNTDPLQIKNYTAFIQHLIKQL